MYAILKNSKWILLSAAILFLTLFIYDSSKNEAAQARFFDESPVTLDSPSEPAIGWSKTSIHEIWGDPDRILNNQFQETWYYFGPIRRVSFRNGIAVECLQGGHQTGVGGTEYTSDH